MQVKICGLKRREDAIAAAALGADALGFVMGGLVLPYEIEPAAQHVREMIKSVGGKAETYLVTHLKEPKDILALAEYIGCSGIQVSEDIGVAGLKSVREGTSRKLIKTIVVGKGAATKLRGYEPFCDFILLDTRHKGYTGGTGEVNDWSLCKKLVQLSKKPVYLAGGLNPSNLSTAINEVKPAGVDVSTGVSTFSKSNPRKDAKDHAKIRKFIEVAKVWV